MNSGKDLNCPRYWIDASHVDLGCLLFNATSPLLWIEAENFCGGSGNSAHLVEIFNEYQQDFLVAEALQSELLTGQSRPWWIGLTGIYRILIRCRLYCIKIYMKANLGGIRQVLVC